MREIHAPNRAKTKRRVITEADRARGRRFRASREAVGLSQKKLGELCGLSAQSIQQWESGQTQPEPRHYIVLSNMLRKPIEWLADGTTFRRLEVDTGGIFPSLTAVPLLSYGEARDMKNRKAPGIDTVKEYASYPISEEGFALQVRDDSMAPDLPEGVTVFIDPQVKAQSGSFVLAVTDETAEPTIKEYVLDGSMRYLKPRNQRYEQIRLNDTARIIGVVVEMRKLLNPPPRR